MLDASVLMMQQYSTIANKYPIVADSKDAETQTSTDDGTTTAAASEVKAEVPSASTVEDIEKPGTSTAHEYEVPPLEPKAPDEAASESIPAIPEPTVEKAEIVESNEAQSAATDVGISRYTS